MTVPLNLGIRAHDLGQLTLPELATRLRQYGLTHIQFALNKSFPESVSHLTGLSIGTGQYYRHGLASQQLTISVLGCYVNLIDPNPLKRQQALMEFKTHLRVAHSFGAELVGTETGSLADGYTERNFSEAAYQAVLSAVSELVAEGERFGVVVAIEAGINHPIYSVERLERLLKEIPSNNLQIILDVTNLLTLDNYHRQDALIAQALAAVGDRIAHLHLKDYKVVNGGLQVVPIGHGQMNFTPLLKYLKDTRPHLTATMEETPEPYVAGSIAFLRKLYEEV